MDGVAPPLKLMTRLLELAVTSERSRCAEYLYVLPFPGRMREGMSGGIYGVGRGVGGRVSVDLSAAAKRMPARLQSGVSGDASLSFVREGARQGAQETAHSSLA